MKRPRLSDFPEMLPVHPIIAIEAVWIDGMRFRLADDGQTLLPDPETQLEKDELIALISRPS